MSAKETIRQIIALDEQIAALRDTFEQFPAEEQTQVLGGMFRELLGTSKTDDPLPLGLVRTTELFCNLPGDAGALALADGLAHDNTDVRLLCGDALLHLATDGLERIMPAIEKVLAKGGVAAEELPFLLTDVDDPEVTRVIERFLGSKESEVVAAAIEALAEFGDPSAVPALERLKADTRKVVLDEEEDSECTIADLIADALDVLTEDEDE